MRLLLMPIVGWRRAGSTCGAWAWMVKKGIKGRLTIIFRSVRTVEPRDTSVGFGKREMPTTTLLHQVGYVGKFDQMQTYEALTISKLFLEWVLVASWEDMVMPREESILPNLQWRASRKRVK